MQGALSSLLFSRQVDTTCVYKDRDSAIHGLLQTLRKVVTTNSVKC